MRTLLLSLAMLVGPCPAQSPAPPTNPPASTPIANPRNKKAAEKEFKKGLSAKEKGHNTEALEYFRQAADFDSQNINYLTAREAMKQFIVYERIQDGNKALLAGNRIEAMAAFRSALELDPANDFAKQRLQDSLPEIPRIVSAPPEEMPGALEMRLRPADVKRSFHFRGNARDLLEQIARAYNLAPYIDESVSARRVRFELDNVSWATAMDVAARMTKVFWTPLSANQVLFAADNDQTRRQFQRMTMRTFYVPDASTPQDLNEIANILRILFDIRYITQQPSQNSLIVRAPQPVLDAAVSFLNGLSTSKPQVMLDIKAYEISSSATRQVGVGMPTSFTVYNVPTELQKLLGNQSVQDIINQLIASGAINQANSSAIAALIAQGLNQQSSIFATPFLLFGGGTTLSAVTIPPVPIKFSVSKSDIRSVEHAILRGSQNTATTFKIGTRVPIINATFAPIYNTPEIAKVLGNQSYIPPVPSFQFEDIGLSLKATPQIREKDVTLNLELQVRALGPTALNGLPVISNREYKGVVSAQDGTTIVLAGMLSPSEQHGLTGIPLLGQIPVAGRLFATENKQENDTELLIVITPHIVSRADRAGEEIVMPANAPR